MLFATKEISKGDKKIVVFPRSLQKTSKGCSDKQSITAVIYLVLRGYFDL